MGNELDKKVTSVIKTTFTPTGDYDADKKRAETYAKAVGMDSANTKVAVLMATQGMDAGAKAMINEHTDENGKFDYAARRARYG